MVKMKRIVSLLLGLIIAFGCVTVAFAADGVKMDCPFIDVHGFMAVDLLADKDDPDSDVIWPPKTDDILSTVREVLPALSKFLITRDYDELSDAIIDPVNNLIGKANLGKNGEPVDNSGVYFVYPDKDRIKKDSALNFRYDWRLDPFETAEQLNDFIEYVCKCSGCSQVTLNCHSFGGIVTQTYYSRYGYKNRIRSICYNTTAIFGESYTGEMLSGNIVLNADALTAFLETKMGSQKYSKLLNGVLDIFNSAGITDDICALGNKLVEGLAPKVIPACIAPMFGGWLSIWAMCPDEYVEQDMKYIFDEVYGGDYASYAGLREKIIKYNTLIRPQKTKLLKEHNRQANLYVFSRYNFSSIPLVPSWRTMSDSVVDTKASSFGATCAEYESTLPDDVAAKNAGYINPDKTICAATCLFPDQTWFIRDMEHSEGSWDLDTLMFDLLYHKGQATVKTFKEHPQFLKWSSEDDSVTPDTDGSAKTENFFDRLFGKYLDFLAYLRSVYEKIFKNNRG